MKAQRQYQQESFWVLARKQMHEQVTLLHLRKETLLLFSRFWVAFLVLSHPYWAT